MDALIKAKDGERDCWWLDKRAEVEFKVKDKEVRVAGLEISNSGSESIIKMLGPLTEPGQHHERRKILDIEQNSDCILGDIKNKGAKRVIIALNDPVSRILKGIEDHIDLHGHWLQEDERLQRRVFNHNFKSADEYIDALRDPDSESGMHKRAMAVTHCRHCLSFMLPVTGFYIRDAEKDIADPDVEFVCSCKIEQGMNRIANDWGLELVEDVNMPDLKFNQTISVANRKWIEDTYAADIAFYQEHCSAEC